MHAFTMGSSHKPITVFGCVLVFLCAHYSRSFPFTRNGAQRVARDGSIRTFNIQICCGGVTFSPVCGSLITRLAGSARYPKLCECRIIVRGRRTHNSFRTGNNPFVSLTFTRRAKYYTTILLSANICSFSLCMCLK